MKITSISFQFSSRHFLLTVEEFDLMVVLPDGKKHRFTSTAYEAVATAIVVHSLHYDPENVLVVPDIYGTEIRKLTSFIRLLIKNA